MRISFSSISVPKTGALGVFVSEKNKLSPAARDLDKKTGGAITKALKNNRFSGKKDQLLSVVSPSGVSVSRLVLIGTGVLKDTDQHAAQNMGAAVFTHLAKSGETDITIICDVAGKNMRAETIAAHVGFGAHLRSYRFDKYRTKDTPEQKPSLKNIVLACARPADVKKAYTTLDAVAQGVFFTRDLTSEPPNVLYPISMAEQCKKLIPLGVKVSIFDEKQMKKWGMGALLGVAQGSINSPRLVTMEYKGHAAAKDKRPLAFVGKGVTFDSGGISLKPGPGMDEMKFDMAGAGAVIGLIHALAMRKAKVNVVGVVGLVENMPSGTAQRPGDVVTSMSGQTIEILNTDAEGRLVLADALWYTQNTYKPRLVVDLATLTGAIIVALGHETAGLFSSDDTLAGQLSAAASKTGEPLWRMPLGDVYDRDINCDVADMKNIGTIGVAGSCTAAQFIKRFIQKDIPWAHLDIAGAAWSKKDLSLSPKGATGFGVRLLERFVADHYEG